jgi:tetratricopeptide (TPR) repeat protein
MPSERIHVYELADALSRGGPGRAFAASVAEAGGPLEVGTPVTVRVVAAADAGDERVLASLAEAHAAARRIDHPWVVAPVDHGFTAGAPGRRFWAASPVTEGRTLADVLAGADVVPDLLTESVVRQAAEALEAVHAAGLAGIGLSPDSVVLRDDGSALLVDVGFGAAVRAWWASAEGTPPSAMMCAAPEILDGSAGDATADLYALGALLFRCMTGAWHRPADAKALRGRASEMDGVRPHDERPKCSVFLSEVAYALLRADRRDRIQSASALVEILRERRRSAWWKALHVDEETFVAESPARRAATREPPLPPIPDPAPSPDDAWWARRLVVTPPLRPHATRCVGRDAELAVALDCALGLADTGGRVLLVEGEDGVGKTRLADALVERLAELPAERAPAVLRGEHRRVGIGRPLGAFTEALTGWLHHSRLVGAHDVSPLLGDASAIAASFAAVLSSEDPPAGAAPLTRERLAPAFLRCLRTIAARRPVVLVIENLHWADPEVLDLFEYVARAGADLPLLLVGTFRPVPGDGNLGRHLDSVCALAHARQVRLAPFDAERLTALARELVFPADAAAEVAARVHAIAGGSPGALVETLAALEAEGALVRGGDGVLAAGPQWASVRVPVSTAEAVARRLAPLGPRDRAFLLAACVQGVAFDTDVARIAAGIDTRTAEKVLANLAARGLVLGEGIARRFASHALFDHVHASLDDGALAERHEATAAAFLESRNPDQLPPPRIHGMLSYRVAWHYMLSGRAARGLLYVRSAVDHLRATFRDGDGERLTSLACRAVTGDPSREADLIDLLLERARFLGAQGRETEERETLDEALLRSRERRDLVRESRILLEQARAKQALGDGAAADRDATQALATSHRAGETAVEMRVHLWLAQAAQREQRWQHARAHYLETIEIAGRCHDAVAESEAHHGLGVVAFSMGAFDHAEEELHTALVAHRRRGDLAREAETLACIGNLAAATGDLVRAEGFLRRALAIHLALGDGAGETRVLGLLAMVLQESGCLVEAREAHRACLQRARFLDSVSGVVVALLNVATVDACLARLDEARDAFGEALRVAQALGAARFQGYALTGLGEVSRQRGLTGVARDLLARAAEQFRSAEDPSGLAAALLAAGRIEAFGGADESAKSLLLESYRLAEQQNARQVSSLAHSLLALLAARRGDGDGAERRMAEAALALSDIRASDATRIEMSFIHSLVLRVLGRPAEANRKVFHAEATLLESVRALPDTDRDRVLAVLSPFREILAGADAARAAQPPREVNLAETVQA